MSFAFNQQRLHVWGVVNATPNSFSDGNEVASKETFDKRIGEWSQLDGLDVGAESTAPMNGAIGAQAEQSRLEETLIPRLSSWPNDVVLSIDTYRLETIRWILPQIPASISVVWNDVSGHLDREALDILQQYPRLKYVLCFNAVPSRSETSNHMNYVSNASIGAEARAFFRKNFEVALKHELFSRIIADPGFGFSKSREQNHTLLQQLPTLMDELACPVWMWGVSRKSFLRFPADANPRDPQIQAALDGLALQWINMALDKLHHPHTIVLRTHAPFLMNALKSWQSLRGTWTPNS